MADNFNNSQHNLGFKDLIKLSTRIFTVKPTRTILTILGTSVGISTVVFLISLGYGLQNILLGKLITSQDSLITLQGSFPEEANIVLDTNEINELKKLPNIGETISLAEFQGQVNSGVALIRITQPDFFRLSGTLPTIGTSFTNDKKGVVLTSQALKLLGLSPDDTSINKTVAVTVTYQDPDGTNPVEVPGKESLPIVGIIVDDSEAPFVYVSSDEFVQTPTYYKEVFFKATDINGVEPLRDALLAKGMIISAKIDLVNQAQKILNVITIVLGVFGVAALTVSAIGMFNTMIVSFLERTYEVGVMKSLGAMDSDVRNLFLMESAIMGLAGGVTGVGLGIVGGQLFNFGLNLLAHKLGSVSIKLFYTPSWFVALVLVSSTFIGLFAGFWPARRASGLSPKEAFLRK